MKMDKSGAIKSRGPGVTAAILALFLLICLVESATGSCLSYGHSCWGAHGKRSSRPPVTAPDWYLTRMLRRVAVNAEMARPHQLPSKNDLSDIFQMDMTDDAPATEKLLNENQDITVETGPISRTMEAKPMLDDELLSKIKIWQLMREAAEDN